MAMVGSHLLPLLLWKRSYRYQGVAGVPRCLTTRADRNTRYGSVPVEYWGFTLLGADAPAIPFCIHHVVHWHAAGSYGGGQI